MAVDIFIGNLNYETDSVKLKNYLIQFGEILECNVITDKYTFRSKGFARAETPDKTTAEEIINKASGTLLDGRPLKIDFYKTT